MLYKIYELKNIYNVWSDRWCSKTMCLVCTCTAELSGLVYVLAMKNLLYVLINPAPDLTNFRHTSHSGSPYSAPAPVTPGGRPPLLWLPLLRGPPMASRTCSGVAVTPDGRTPLPRPPLHPPLLRLLPVAGRPFFGTTVTPGGRPPPHADGCA